MPHNLDLKPSFLRFMLYRAALLIIHDDLVSLGDLRRGMAFLNKLERLLAKAVSINEAQKENYFFVPLHHAPQRWLRFGLFRKRQHFAVAGTFLLQHEPPKVAAPAPKPLIRCVIMPKPTKKIKTLLRRIQLTKLGKVGQSHLPSDITKEILTVPAS